ncbi:DNA topoisomerase 2-associated protein pat1 [Ceratocystis pirilliformis]|uniref:DNA topoisomerase 2-associated protein pat1 n=1 Tax=Ceratocystis pirilliformis TaxID=259994 RepID=A0ABR3Z984_9PEZI
MAFSNNGRHNATAPGFSQAYDPFAGLSGDNEGETIDFEDTYDGLGDNLQETGDDFNDDTFGGGSGNASVGRDFDFFGQTARVANAMEEEHLRFNRQPANAAPQSASQPAQQSSYYTNNSTPQHVAKPVRSGYEKYTEPDPADLHVDLSLWGMAPSKPSPAPAPAATASGSILSIPVTSGRKMMSLEEVEAAMHAGTQAAPQTSVAPQAQQHQMPVPIPGLPEQDFLYAKIKSAEVQPQIQQQGMFHEGQQILPHLMNPHAQQQHMQMLQRAQIMGLKLGQVNASQLIAMQVQHAQGHNRTSSAMGDQNPMLNVSLTAEEKAMFLDQETKRAKRNHKLWLLSKDNGLMTHQDKNFITRIQLQQLVTATGISSDPNDEAALNDDFYYQVHASISGGHRMNPNQPLNNFAQTYLNQTGNRHGRRQGRSGENHVQRMEQQVQRAVEAAKNKPKQPQLVVAGSLGKISFSNAKTPKPLLNIRKLESNDKKAPSTSVLDRKAVLRNIEKVYETLMKLEDHSRLMPRPTMPGSGIDEAEYQDQHNEWSEKAQGYNNTLWEALKVHEPIGATAVHPFIAFLSFNKGKKAIPRVFSFASIEQRTTILTMIVYHLDKLDVVAGAQVDTGEVALNAALRENIDLFSTTVMPSLFRFLNDSDLSIVDGLLDLISTSLNLDLIARTRIGTSMLTLILSRAELLKQAGGGNPGLWSKWDKTFGNFFDTLSPSLPFIFPGSVVSGEDIYVWQLLAAIGVSASPEQQQRLVLSVKDRVLSTVAHAKTLPHPMSSQRLSNVNLFMQSIGLDVELLG